MGEPGMQRRRRREDPAGGAEIAPGRWALPGVDLDTFFTMRRTPPEHRAGFRAWVRAQDRTAVVKRHLTDWDNMMRAFASAPLK